MTEITLGGRRYTIKREWLHKTRAVFRFTGNTFARGFKWRRRLMPLYLLGMAVFSGALCSAAPQSVQSAVFTSLCAAVTAAVWMARRKRAERPLKPRERRYVLGNLGIGSVLLLLTAKFGPFTPPVPGLLFAWFVGGLGVPWWWYYRIRPVEEAPLMLKEDRERLWDEKLAASGCALPGSELTDVEDIKGVEGAWKAIVDLPGGKLTCDDVTSKAVKIAGVYRVPVSSIVAEHDDDGSEHRAVLSIYTRNPLQQTHYWDPAAFDPVTGISRIGVFADMDGSEYQHFKPKSGAVHTLISGSPDSGKSRLVDQLLATERHAGGLIVSVVADPQRGQSLPEWQDNVSHFAGSAEDGVIELLVQRDVMFARNERYAKMVWKDDQDRERKGKNFFEPGRVSEGGDPLYSLTIEEAHEVFKCNPLAVQAAEAISLMGRKCGCKLRLITQMPLLSQLGNSSPMRDAVSSGNVICLRTASGLSGQVAFQSSFSVAPHKLPRAWPGVKDPVRRGTAGLGYVLGAQARPSVMRTSMIDDVFGWATKGQTWQLGAEDQAVATLSRAQWTAILKEGADTPEKVVTSMFGGGRKQSSKKEEIVKYLATVPYAFSGAIAGAVDTPLSNVSTALGRLAKEGRVTSLGHGKWAILRGEEETEEEAS